MIFWSEGVLPERPDGKGDCAGYIKKACTPAPGPKRPGVVFPIRHFHPDTKREGDCQRQGQGFGAPGFSPQGIGRQHEAQTDQDMKDVAINQRVVGQPDLEGLIAQDLIFHGF